MTFQLPNSSQPSTPSKAFNGANGSLTFASHLSTTPAGAPTSRSLFSTTPAVPPPADIFGSSKLGSAATTGLFQKQTSGNGNRPGHVKAFKASPKSAFASRAPKATVKPSFLGNHRVQAPGSDDEEYDDTEEDNEDGDDDGEGEASEADEEYEDEEEDEDEDGEGEEYDEDEDEQEDVEGSEEEEEEDEDEEADNSLSKLRKPDFMKSTEPTFDWEGLANEDGVGLSPKGLKRSREVASASLIQSIEAELPPAKRRESTLPRIAKDLAKSQTSAVLEDPDQLILGTEQAVKKFHNAASAPRMGMHYQEELQKAFHEVPQQLVKVWSMATQNLEPNDENLSIGIGPTEDSHSASKAAFVGALLLILHHQPLARQPVPSSFAPKRSLANSVARLSFSEENSIPYPKIFVEFLEEKHNIHGHAVTALLGHRPSPTANKNYWDILISTILRGRLSLAAEILQRSDFRHAWSALSEGQDHVGYQGAKLNVVDQVVGKLIEVLLAAPALREGEWDVTNDAWALFRRALERALADLVAAAEGDKPGTHDTLFEAPNFGIKAPTFKAYGLSNADGRVPPSVYTSVKIIYSILLGRTPEIIYASHDWLEATLALAIWWNGEDEADRPTAGLKSSRRSALGRSHLGHQRIVDTDPAAAYRRRLALVVDVVTNGPENETLMVDTSNSVEVAVASVFEGNVEGVLGLLQLWSIPITSAVLEIATRGGWYESPATNAPPEGFDESDLMVLSYAQPDRGLLKDEVLLAYSDLLFEKAQIGRGRSSIPGWELAIEVSSRLDDAIAANKRIVWILNKVSLNEGATVNKVIDVCRKHGLEDEARNTAKRHADKLASETQGYGSALVFYASAYERKKCKNVLDLLISLCLVRSSAYPLFEEQKKDQDDILPKLLLSPRQTLQAFNEYRSEDMPYLDENAADIISDHLSGYATLRRFYALRDEEVRPGAIGSVPSGLRPKARRQAAAKALVACIASAADTISGGLYDSDRENILEHDVLLALLAEATVFVGSGDRVLNLDQLMLLLRSVEDLQTVHWKIRKQCEECFKACLDAKYDSTAYLDPTSMMKKSVSGLTEGSGFSLIGSEITESSSAGRKKAKSKGDSVKRGWDWRSNFGRDITGDDVLQYLRKGIAKDIALHWIDGL